MAEQSFYKTDLDVENNIFDLSQIDASDENGDATEDGAQVVLEQGQRLSQSKLWQLQRNYFDSQGIEAWRQGEVPHYVTSNSFIAGAYARVVFGYFRDCQATVCPPNGSLLDLDQPLYIVELGAGSGRFAYHFLKQFSGVYRHLVQNDIRFKYIMTDFTERNIDCWRSHTSLQPFVEEGLLDFACFDAEHDEAFELIGSGESLSPGSVRNPVVVLANYFFDSIPMDAFSIEEGQLHESLVTLSVPREASDLKNPEVLSQVEVSYDHQPVTGDYYGDPEWNRILQDYGQRLAGTGFLFPTAALQCLHRLECLSGGRLLLLSGDNGDSREDTLLNQGDPEPIMHGSFSLGVNYHALGQYVRNKGGVALHTAHRHASLSVCAFLLGNPSRAYPETRQAYLEAVENFGPDDFFNLKKGLQEAYHQMDTEQVLACLRLSGWDAKIMLECGPALMDNLEDASEPLKQEVYRAIERVWDCYYPIGEEADLAFQLGMMLYKMQYYPEALNFFERSVGLYGHHPETAYGMGLCYKGLRQMDRALTYVNQALESDPDYEPARALRIQIQSGL